MYLLASEARVCVVRVARVKLREHVHRRALETWGLF